MITVTVFQHGFEVSGHSGYADAGADIVCAAVSSAVQLCECALTDTIRAKTKVVVREKDALVRVTVTEPCQAAEQVLEAFSRHMRKLQEQFPQNIRILEV